MSLQIVSPNDFDEVVLNSDKPVLLDIYADWCGPCKAIAPLLEEIAEENKEIKVIKFNVDESRELAQKYGVRSIPTLLYFVNGEVVKTKVGSVNKGQLLAFIAE